MRRQMTEARAQTMQQEREEVYVVFQDAGSFHCLGEEWKDCEELRPKPEEKLVFMEKIGDNTRHRTEWCAEADKYEMWKRKQIHEDAREMHRTKIPVKKFEKVGKAPVDGLPLSS